MKHFTKQQLVFIIETSFTGSTFVNYQTNYKIHLVLNNRVNN